MVFSRSDGETETFQMVDSIILLAFEEGSLTLKPALGAEIWKMSCGYTKIYNTGEGPWW